MITLFVLLLSVAGMKNAFAQQQQVAILQHNDTLSAFYGPNALNLAHTAAADGDTITLSSGNFEGCILTKAVTIHGAGCTDDTASYLAPTRIVSDVILRNTNETMPLTIEGVWFNKVFSFYGYDGFSGTTKNVRFIKCNVDLLTLGHNYSNNSIRDFYLDNCMIKQYDCRYSSGVILQNCVVRFTNYNQINQYHMNFIYNSVVCLNDNVTLNNTRGFNSIIPTGNGNTASNSTFYNCIDIQTGNSNIFDGQLNQTNMQVNSYEEVFETFAGTVSYPESYQLIDEIATTFLGNDGTEVGIHGGMNPYNPRPPYMIIRNTHVAGRTTEDDKLSVEIELISNGN